jgi:tetratricopeptide (TPR) repeat protein
MKTCILLCLALISTVMAEVGSNDLQDIRAMVKAGQYEAALQKHLWFHEESKKTPAMTGVRLSFALSNWVELGQKYPKALEALTAIRDENDKLLLSGSGGFAEFHESSAISEALQEQDKTYELFKAVHAKYPAVATDCFHVAMDLLVERGDYELCRGYIKDPVKSFEDIRHMRELNLSFSRTNPKFKDASLAEHADRTYKKKTLQLIDVMVHLRKLDEAREIQSRALAYFPDDKIKAAVAAP